MDVGLLKRFRLVRHHDETGVSGTGIIAYGIHFPDGVCVTRWNNPIAQTCVWNSIDHIETIHGHGGNTEIEWLD